MMSSDHTTFLNVQIASPVKDVVMMGSRNPILCHDTFTGGVILLGPI